MKFRRGDELRVHVDALYRRGARVRVDGVDCELAFDRKARPDITRPEGLRAQLTALPVAAGPGSLPRGSKPSVSFGSTVKSAARGPTLAACGELGRNWGPRLREFQARCPVGTLVVGKVLFRRRGDVAVEIEGAIRGRLTSGHCLGVGSRSRERWLDLPKAGQWIEVVVREFNWRAGEVLVSLHRYRDDTKYCTFASGYRRGYSILGGPFEFLPWERGFARRR